MAISLAPLQPRKRDRAESRSGRRRTVRWLVHVFLLAAALLAFATPALAATQTTHATQTTQGTQATNTTQTQTAQKTASASTPVTLTAAVTPALPGGVCQVPGIGDIGGLVGLCASGSSGIVGAVNNICEPSVPSPEQATGGINAMIEPPAAAATGKTLYDSYGIAGQFWAAHGLQCSDMTSLIGNNVAGMVFDAAKSLDRVTITVYQSAAGNNILTWLQDSVNRLITELGNAIYFPYLMPVVILGAIWLAWQGLVRKRASRTLEGTLWMVVACAAAIALIGNPQDFTGVGTTVSNGATEVLNTAFSNLPAPASSNCLPVQKGDPQVTSNYAFTSGNGLVDENANELWSVLVCKPWLYGEFGSTAFTNANGTPSVVGQYGRSLLWAQAIASNETPTTALINAKQATYTGIANSIQQNDPGVYPLFQGNQWTTRLEIAFGAVFAALVAGLLILLIALTLIVLKLGFLLLLVAGPFFLIVGTHPGFGRVIAIRWFEMLVGVLMKQVAIAIVLSVLLYCYSLIMGTTDAVLPWALKILMIALVTVAVFIYRKPFQHLFSAVGYGTIGSSERAEYSLRQAGSTFRRSTLDAATVAVPGVAGYRAARWARRNPGQAAALAGGVASGAGVGAAAGSAASAEAAARAGTVASASSDAYASRLRPEAPPPADGEGEARPGSRRVVTGAGSARNKNLPEADSGGGRVAPPLDLPPRSATNGSAGSSGPAGSAGAAGSAGVVGTASGWSRGAGRSAAPGPVGPRSRAVSSGPTASAGRSGSAGSPPPITRSSRSTTSSGSSGSSGSSRSNGGNGGGSRQAGPAWPASSWAGAGARSRSGTAPRPNPAPAEPAGQHSPGAPGGQPANGDGKDDRPARPFWLRPVRRDK
ncbi:MAG: type IV secretion system protein [Streptosporangiaceae bacterium]